VKRLVEATRGWVELDIEKLDRIGVSVRVTVFAESDWASFDKIWFAKVDDQPSPDSYPTLPTFPSRRPRRSGRNRCACGASGVVQRSLRRKTRRLLLVLVGVLGLLVIATLALIGLLLFLWLR
jgi:hypothetical protein